jgi:cell wall-associated NlpC family hydrolase
MYGICHLGMVPCRAEASNQSEMVNQLLFGEPFKILEEKEEWARIRSAWDHYEAYINRKQFIYIREETFNQLMNGSFKLSAELISSVNDLDKSESFLIPMGSILPGKKADKFSIENLHFESLSPFVSPSVKGNRDQIISTAKKFLRTPYLWGGKTALGIDCSGFTQIVHRVNGYFIPRDAWQQAELGNALSFVEEAQPGDMAFFDNAEGKITHVGIVMENNHIIHASGQVRIDRFDHYGIFHSERKKYSHNLRVIKSII